MHPRVKIVYLDEGNHKVIFCKLVTEDSLFFYLLTSDQTNFRISKTAVVSLKEVQND